MAEAEADLRGRTLVKDPKGRIGVVVSCQNPDCGDEFVLVEFNGSSGTEKTERQKLVAMGSLKIEFGIGCVKCAYHYGRVCCRYWRPASAFVPTDGQKKPTDIYPYCQQR
jgi:hypothetical protein